ncbi:MAG TPA: M3 family oligoendopeptidase [Anaerolineaceae bacterium]|nr:M3 family oligoendopeptidase [Anaerolineaceae bacterium]
MFTPEKTYTQSRWSLADLFPSIDSPELESAFKSLADQVNMFEAIRPQLNENMEPSEFLKIIQQLENIERLGNRIYAYASLLLAEDTQNQAALTLIARVEQFVAEISNQLLFFDLWWKELSDDAADRLMADIGDYRYWLEEMRHFKPYTLSEPEEKIINIKNVTGASAIDRLYDSITNRYTFNVELDGKIQEITRGELMVYARDPDPDLRARTYQELYRVFGNDAPILGQIYQALVHDWRNEQVALRKFASPIAARNLGNDIPDEMVTTLLKVCQRNAPIFQRYFKLKARWLGMERLRRYDVYAPLAISDKEYTFSQAANMVLDSFNRFDEGMAEMAQRVFSKQHLDSEVRKGKRSGGFCLTALPDLTPWILVNYQGKASDVATMAHEFGHAIHSMLASDHSIFTAHPSLPLAETASTFGEMMLVDRMLKEETNESVKRDLLFRQVDDAYATILRQAYFALFENQAHEMINQNASVDDLASAYLENLRDQFGDSVDVADEFRMEWISIPHIYNSPFYVYAYAFGQLLVLSLYQQYQAEGASFKPRYLKLLSAGGSEPPVKVLADAGIDIRQDSFWQGGMNIVNHLVDQLEKIPIQNS